MIQANLLDLNKRILILNRPAVLNRNDFYINICKIPEVLSRLCQYRELLSDNEITIPLWVYYMTQDLGNIKGVLPQPAILNFIVNLGLFDRYISKKGWPDYMTGTQPLISAVTGEESFEGISLLLTHGYKWNEEDFSLYKVHSYYNTKTNSSALTSLKKINEFSSFNRVLDRLSQYERRDSLVFQLLSPNEQHLKYQLESLHLTVRDFLEEDEGLRWLWPLWKRAQLAGDRETVSQTAH